MQVQETGPEIRVVQLDANPACWMSCSPLKEGGSVSTTLMICTATRLLMLSLTVQVLTSCSGSSFGDGTRVRSDGHEWSSALSQKAP
jgi:hypothetical protein